MTGFCKIATAALILTASASFAQAQSAFVGTWDVNWLDPQSNCTPKGPAPAPVKETADCSGRLVLKYDQQGTGLTGLKAHGAEIEGYWEVKGTDGLLHGTLSSDGTTLTGKYYILAGTPRVGDFQFKLAAGNAKRFDGWYKKNYDPAQKDKQIDWWGVKK